MELISKAQAFLTPAIIQPLFGLTTPLEKPCSSYMSQLYTAMNLFEKSNLAVKARELTLARSFEADYSGSNRSVICLGDMELPEGRVPIGLKRWTSRSPSKEVALFEPFFLKVAAEKRAVEVPKFTFAINVDGKYALITEDLSDGGKYQLQELRNVNDLKTLVKDNDIEDKVAMHLMRMAQVYGNVGLDPEICYRLVIAGSLENDKTLVGSCSYAVIEGKEISRLVCADVDQLFSLEKMRPDNGYLRRVTKHPELLDEMILNI